MEGKSLLYTITHCFRQNNKGYSDSHLMDTRTLFIFAAAAAAAVGIGKIQRFPYLVRQKWWSCICCSVPHLCDFILDLLNDIRSDVRTIRKEIPVLGLTKISILLKRSHHWGLLGGDTNAIKGLVFINILLVSRIYEGLKYARHFEGGNELIMREV